MGLPGALGQLTSSCCPTTFSDQHNARAVERNVLISSSDEAGSTSLSGSIVMGTLDYSLDNIVEVLDAVASDRCWREGQPRLTFRSIVLLAQCCSAGGGSSYVAAPGLLVHVRSGQGHGYFLAGGQGFYDAFGPVWRREPA